MTEELSATQTASDGAHPLVTVVIPVRNAARYIGRSVQSILDNDYPNTEIIVVDDHSDDGSGGEAKRVGGDRVEVIPCAGSGISAAFNTGLAAARGEYLMRCDADDMFTLERISIQVNWMQEHPDVAAMCGVFDYIWEDDSVVLGCRPEAEAKCISDELKAGKVGVRMPTAIFRTDALRAVGGCREFFETGEDDDLMMRLGEQYPVWRAPFHVYSARLRASSITRTQSLGRLKWYIARAKEFQRERIETGSDALERRNPPPVPAEFPAGKVYTPARFAQHILMGASWKSLDRGERRASIRYTMRAISYMPLHPMGYQHLFRLLTVLIVRKLRGADRRYAAPE